MLYEFKLGFAFEVSRSVAAARLSREAGMCVLDSVARKFQEGLRVRRWGWWCVVTSSYLLLWVS